MDGVCFSGAFSQSGVPDLREVKLIKVVDDRVASDKDQCNAVHRCVSVCACVRVWLRYTFFFFGKKRETLQLFVKLFNENLKYIKKDTYKKLTIRNLRNQNKYAHTMDKNALKKEKNNNNVFFFSNKLI